MDMTLPTDPDNSSVGINLKCDLYERVVDPTLLPSVTKHFVSVNDVLFVLTMYCISLWEPPQSSPNIR